MKTPLTNEQFFAKAKGLGLPVIIPHKPKQGLKTLFSFARQLEQTAPDTAFARMAIHLLNGVTTDYAMKLSFRNERQADNFQESMTALKAYLATDALWCARFSLHMPTRKLAKMLLNKRKA